MADRQVLATVTSRKTEVHDSGASHTRGSELSTATLQPFGVALATLAVLAWVAVFSVGLLIDSAPFRARVGVLNGAAVSLLGDFLIATVTYTVTNIALLGCLAGLIGAIGRTAGLEIQGDGEKLTDKTHPFLSGALRGFVVYLTVLSGILILFENPFKDPTADQYVRLAGLVSIISFVVSYDPRMFGFFLTKVGTFIQGHNGAPPSVESSTRTVHLESRRSVENDEGGNG